MTVPRTQARELGALLDLRDAALALVDRESGTRGADDQLEVLRARTATLWRRHVAAHGPLNRATESVRTDKAGQAVVTRTPPPVMRVFSGDPHAALVLALEDIDRATGAARPAPILSRRVAHAPTPPPHSDDPAAALAASLNTVGRLDLGLIADLLDTTTPTARDRLLASGLVFIDPTEPDALVTAAQYLSGDVRAALRAARAAAADEPALAGNVTALEAVQPPELGIDEIEVRFGASWIPAEIHQDFLRDVLEQDHLTVRNPIGAKWQVNGGDWGVLCTQTWGTPRVPAGKLAEMLMTQRPLVVRDTLEGGRTVVNPDETAALADKADLLTARFADWMWTDPARAATMQTRYNDLFNGLRIRDYTTEGAALTLPGLSDQFTPRPHQREVVARMLACDIGGPLPGRRCREDRRDGHRRRTSCAGWAWSANPRSWSPTTCSASSPANGSSCTRTPACSPRRSDDLAPRDRPAFVAQAATHDWDAIILTRTAFTASRSGPPPRPGTSTSRSPRCATPWPRWTPTAPPGAPRKAIESKVLRGGTPQAARRETGSTPGSRSKGPASTTWSSTSSTSSRTWSPTSAIPDPSIEGSTRASDLHMKLSTCAPGQRPGHRRGHRHPDRELDHRGARDAALPGPRPADRHRHHPLRPLVRHVRPQHRRRWRSPPRAGSGPRPAPATSTTSPNCR